MFSYHLHLWAQISSVSGRYSLILFTTRFLPTRGHSEDSWAKHRYSQKRALLLFSHPIFVDVVDSYNVNLAKPGVQLMATGAHTMQEITCATCSTYVGWKIVRAHESSETWKEGYSLLELENLHLQTDLLDAANMSQNPRRSSSSSSDSDYGL